MNLRLNVKLTGLMTAMLLLPACATAIRGPNVSFKVVTDPPGANVTTDLPAKNEKQRSQSASESHPQFRGCSPTPCEFQVSRRAEFTAMIEQDGYHPAKVEITSGLGQGVSAASATGAIVVAGGAYGALYGVASFWPMVFGSSANAGAAAGATQLATGVGVLFVGVDLASGAMLDVRPNPLVLIMIPETEPLPEDTFIDTEEELNDLLENRNSNKNLKDVS